MSLSKVSPGDDLQLHIFRDDSNSELFLEQVTVRWSRGHEFACTRVSS